MYSDNIQDLKNSVSEIRNMSTTNINFVKRFETNYNRKEEWIRLYRLDLLYRNHETNNYAEASIRIIKDILLCRTKAYNAVALVDFIVNVGENYFTLRLLDHAHDRHSESHRLYTKLCSRMVLAQKDDIKKVNDCIYSIPSKSDPNIVYLINTELGVCSCKIGCAGAFCKHQAWIHEHFKIQLPNLPAIDIFERHALGQLALGDKCPEQQFFQGLKNNPTHNIISSDQTKIINKDLEHSTRNEINEQICSINFNEINTNQQELSQPADSKLYEEEALHEWSRLQNMIPSLPLIILKKLTKRLKNIKSNQQFASLIHSVSTGSINRRGKISVQPTSISRRKDGVTRGSKRIPAGRKPNNIDVKRKRKRLNNLEQNISKNVLNAKSHGRCH